MLNQFLCNECAENRAILRRFFNSLELQKGCLLGCFLKGFKTKNGYCLEMGGEDFSLFQALPQTRFLLWLVEKQLGCGEAEMKPG